MAEPTIVTDLIETGAETPAALFGQLVSRYIIMRGLTLQDVARLAYNNEERVPSVSDVRSGRRYKQPRPDTIARYRDALHIPQWEIDEALSLRPARKAPPESHRPTVAVFPFYNTGDPGDQYFAGGMTDDVISKLTRFRNVDVMSRRSTMQFDRRDLTELGRKFDVRYLIDGAVYLEKSTRRIRVDVWISDIETRRQLWAEQFYRPYEDVFDIQNEISGLVVWRTAAKVEELELGMTRESRPGNLDAYAAVLRGQNHLFNFNPTENVEARAWYEQATERDPRYGRAFAGLSRTHSYEWRHGWGADPDLSQAEAGANAARAIQLDANDARGHAEMGFVQLYMKQHERSLASYERALELNPNDADIIADYADALKSAGQPEEALTYFTRAMRLNPYCPDGYLWSLAGAHFYLHEFDKTIETIGRMSDASQGRRLLAASYAHLDRLSDARRVADLIMAAEPGFSVGHWEDVVPVKRSEDLQLYVDGLLKAGLPK